MNNQISRNIDDIKNKALPLLKKYKVEKAGIFGSTVRGDYKNDSDIDILVSFPQNAGISLFEVAGLKIDLEETLGAKVDLVQYDVIKPALRNYILQDEIKIL